MWLAGHDLRKPGQHSWWSSSECGSPEPAGVTPSLPGHQHGHQSGFPGPGGGGGAAEPSNRFPSSPFCVFVKRVSNYKRRAKNNSHTSEPDAVSHLSLLLSRRVSELSRRRTRLPRPAAAPSSGSGILRMHFLLAGE